MSGLPLPDFIIGGAPRSGTTWLYSLLARHPQVAMAEPLRPEPKFFLVDDLYQRGLRYYSDTWFASLPATRLLGEKSANYMESPVAAKRIAADLPNVKMVFILRDPVERAWSNYRWSRMNGLETEDFLTALHLESDREQTLPDRLRYARPHAYLSRGLYRQHLGPFFAHLGREQILCLRFEDIRENPSALVERLHRFLGIAPGPETIKGLGVVNAAEEAEMPGVARRYMQDYYEEPNRALGELLGDEFAGWGPKKP